MSEEYKELWMKRNNWKWMKEAKGTNDSMQKFNQRDEHESII